MKKNFRKLNDTRRVAMVRDKVLKLAKVPGTENVADALTKSLPAPTLHKHWEYLLGTRTPFQACFAMLQIAPAA